MDWLLGWRIFPSQELEDLLVPEVTVHLQKCGCSSCKNPSCWFKGLPRRKKPGLATLPEDCQSPLLAAAEEAAAPPGCWETAQRLTKMAKCLWATVQGAQYVELTTSKGLPYWLNLATGEATWDKPCTEPRIVVRLWTQGTITQVPAYHQLASFL
ncbi:unnamed protein product [Symbiodinium sp. CCMP2592]|nr:unnamed protein product [Symbiodinium sp. CCMP2592]